MAAASALSCKLCSAIMACPQDEVDAFIASFQKRLDQRLDDVLEADLHVFALDFCAPCFAKISEKAKTPAPTEGPGYIYGRDIRVSLPSPV